MFPSSPIFPFLIRLILFIGLPTLSPISSLGQNKYWWNADSGSYQTPQNWIPERWAPNALDTLIFQGHALVFQFPPSDTIAHLSVTEQASITWHADTVAFHLVINPSSNETNHQPPIPIIHPSSVLTLTGPASIQIEAIGENTFEIYGTIKVQVGAHRWRASAGGKWIFKSNSRFETAPGFTGSPFGTSSIKTVDFDSNATYVSAFGANPFGATAPASTVSFLNGSKYIHARSTAPQLSGRTYGHFIIRAASSYNIGLTRDCIIQNDLSIESGAMQFRPSSGAGNIILGGNIKLNPGITHYLGSAGWQGSVLLNNPQASKIFSLPVNNPPPENSFIHPEPSASNAVPSSLAQLNIWRMKVNAPLLNIDRTQLVVMDSLLLEASNTVVKAPAALYLLDSVFISGDEFPFPILSLPDLGAHTNNNFDSSLGTKRNVQGWIFRQVKENTTPLLFPLGNGISSKKIWIIPGIENTERWIGATNISVLSVCQDSSVVLSGPFKEMVVACSASNSFYDSAVALLPGLERWLLKGLKRTDRLMLTGSVPEMGSFSDKNKLVTVWQKYIRAQNPHSTDSVCSQRTSFTTAGMRLGKDSVFGDLFNRFYLQTDPVDSCFWLTSMIPNPALPAVTADSGFIVQIGASEAPALLSSPDWNAELQFLPNQNALKFCMKYSLPYSFLSADNEWSQPLPLNENLLPELESILWASPGNEPPIPITKFPLQREKTSNTPVFCSTIALDRVNLSTEFSSIYHSKWKKGNWQFRTETFFKKFEVEELIKTQGRSTVFTAEIPQSTPIKTTKQTSQKIQMNCESIDCKKIYSNFVLVRFEKKQNAEDVLLYPNPAKEKISIIFNQLCSKSEWRVVSISGIFQMKGFFEGHVLEIPISKLPSGVYYVQLISKNENRTLIFTKQ